MFADALHRLLLCWAALAALAVALAIVIGVFLTRKDGQAWLPGRLPDVSLTHCDAKAPACRQGDEALLHHANICARIQAILAAGEHRFSAVLPVHASSSRQVNAVESARKQSPWGRRAWGARP